MAHSIIESIKGGLIVSCQALEGEPFYGSEFMTRFAISAEMGNAVGIRANTPQDISAIKCISKLPLIGLWKREYSGFDVYITPTMEEVEGVIAAGADIVAVDATKRERPDGLSLSQVVKKIRRKHEVLIMADISTLDEGLIAEQLGFDLISTTLSGYTPYSPLVEEPDFQLIADLSSRVQIPVLGEGRIHSPEQALRCLQEGAYAVVIGGAITRPQEIVKKYVQVLSHFQHN